MGARSSVRLMALCLFVVVTGSLLLFGYGPARAQDAAAKAAVAPQISENFHGWTGAISPDGLWRRNGDWTATGNNLFKLTNCVMSETLDGQSGGYLRLTVNAGVLQGGEIQTYSGGTGIGYKCNYGYYEVRMKVTSVSGCCVSFFRMGKSYSGNPEIDLEFLTNESWNTPTSTTGRVWCMLHRSGSNEGGPRSFPFNPTTGFHTYGFLWTAQQLQWLADKQVIQTIANVTYTGDGIIMMNAWTGAPTWGGGPPATEANSYYDYVKYWPNATSIQVDSSSGIRLDLTPVSTMPMLQCPNPVRNLTDLRIDRPDAMVSLYDLSGQAVGRFLVQDGRIVNAPQNSVLTSSMYLLAVDGAREMQKIILVK